MTTWALLGLLVVLLVAIGIAALLRRGRKRDEAGPAPTADPAAPPRTVRDLVEHRRGLVERGADPTPDRDPSGSDGRAVDAAQTVHSADTAHSTGTAESAGTARSVGTGQSSELSTAVGDGAPAEADPEAATPDPDTDTIPADPDTARTATVGGAPTSVSSGCPTASSSSDTAGNAGAAGNVGAAGNARAATVAGTDAADPAVAAGGERSDVDAGPVGPPWSRGFVDGRPVEPPPAASHRPRPTPHARTTSGTGVTPHGADATPITPAGADEAEADATGTTADSGVAESGSSRPGAPPRRESRSPVDPDLVKRVTAVPGDRSAGSRTSTQDTEREYRQARDRISAPASTGRVPEQGGPAGPSPARRPSPVPLRDRSEPAERPDEEGTSTSVVTGAAAPTQAPGADPGPATATGGPAAEDPEDRSHPAPATRTSVPGGPPLGPTGEPAPRPTPRLMRSSAPATDADVADLDDDPDTAAVAVPAESSGDESSAGSSPPGSSPVVAFRHRPAPSPATPAPGTARQDVEVRVTGRDAEPVGGLAVALLDGSGGQVGSGTTDGDGTATLRVPGSGRYVLVSSAEGYQPGVATCAVADGPARVSLTVTRSAAVRGVVRAASGSPVAGVAVTLDQDGEAVGQADTGPDGEFRIADLGAGHYRLATGTGAGAVSQAVRLAAEADVEQDLRIAR